MKLYETMGYVIAAKCRENAVEIACDKYGLDLDEYVDYGYVIIDLPEYHWDRYMFILDLNGEPIVDWDGEPVTQTYAERFRDLGYGEGVLSEEF